MAAAALLAAAGVAGCAEAEQAARGVVEQAARDAVAEAEQAAGTAAEESARAAAGDAVDEALQRANGTCDQLLDVPVRTREENAGALLRAYWLTELTADTPSPETIEAFHDAVVERCEDSLETQAADIISEVWDTGEFAP